MGDGWYDKLDRFRRGDVSLRESAEAVDASAFSAITGQLLIDTVREKYQFATMVGNEMFSTMPITNGNLGTQREPWLSRVKQDPLPINQGMPYPHTSFDPQYVDYPAPVKYGEICNVTMEMIFSDLTSQAIESAESIGEMTGLWEEYQKLALVLGLVNNHNWNGTSYNTYLTSGSWVNKLTDFVFTDWRSVNRVEQLFAQMTDPVTGKPIRIDPKDVFVAPTLRYTMRRVLNATEIREGDITTGNGTQTVSSNVLDNNYRLLTSTHARYVGINGMGTAGAPGYVAGGCTAAKMDTVTIWGDFKKAFGWRQVYPLKTIQAPPQNPLEFNQDIVLSVKTSVFGIAVVKDPRFVCLAFNDSAS
jgi:hypothetical protein